MANGIADDLLTNVLLNAAVPVVVAPAMHTEMWEHAATQRNIQLLRRRGVIIIDPEEGELAGGDEGIGRLAEPPTIVDAVAETFARGHDLAGVRFVVTAGGTQEPIDPVRFISNRSSAQQMRDEVVGRFDDADVVVKAAAVADFRPRVVAEGKIKKAAAPSSIELEPTPDIAAELGSMKKTQILVGFAAETDDHVEAARGKLAKKNLDFIVLNDVRATDAGFEVDTNRVLILGADGTEEALPLQLKSGVARAICDRVADALKVRNER
jgi:phosphopantothenoylcysteine decarboxylase/phosphopantothenate--cysteine ligase